MKYKIVTLELKLKLDAGYMNEWHGGPPSSRPIWEEAALLNFVKSRINDALTDESDRYPVTEAEGVESIRVMDSRPDRRRVVGRRRG